MKRLIVASGIAAVAVLGVTPVASAEPYMPAEIDSTICGWLHNPAWTLDQIESSTGDMLANDNPSYRGEADIKAAIAAAARTCS